MTLGDAIFTARTTKGWSLRELEKRSGVSNPIISQIENQHVKNPGWWTVVSLASALNLNLAALALKDKP